MTDGTFVNALRTARRECVKFLEEIPFASTAYAMCIDARFPKFQGFSHLRGRVVIVEIRGNDMHTAGALCSPLGHVMLDRVQFPAANGRPQLQAVDIWIAANSPVAI